ncbi:MAG: adenylate/guanylate cyclase domain-containing protein [Thermodesulfobacteriota bacterium]|nr:adenylate/guanylate cyclase domain-containing protein [Thermodesulfobacteriota bacterium]
MLMWPFRKPQKKDDKKERDLKPLDTREYQLWLLSILIIIVLTLGILVPNVIRSLTSDAEITIGGLNQYFYINILAIMILLFTLYLILKQREIRRLRAALLGEERYSEELEKHMNIMTGLFEISTYINKNIDIDDILKSIVQQVVKCMEADYSSLLLTQEDNKSLKVQASYGKEAEYTQNALIPIGESVDGWVAERGESLLLNGEVDPIDFPGVENKNRKIISALCVPLKTEEEVIGVLNLNRTETNKYFSQKDLKLLTIFGNHAAAAIKRAKLMKESHEKKRLRTILAQYHSPDVVDEMLRYPSSEGLVEEKVLTVMFADIRGFSKLLGNLEISYVKDFLDTFFSSMTRIIFKYQGTVDKFIGDAIMAFFGAPLVIEKPEYKCVEAAREMVQSFNKQKEEWTARFSSLGSIGLGVGISTNRVFIGNVGSKYRYDYTVIGEGVVVAERLSNLAKANQILISEGTYKKCKDLFEFNRKYKMKVPGIQNHLIIYDLM